MAEEAAASVVNVRKMCLVKPAIPSPTQSMFLSSFDLFWIRNSSPQVLYFYKLSPTIEYTSVIEGLKKSLSSILVHFYRLAGRLKKGESGRTEVDFTETGVEFKEASISVPFGDLEKDGFRRQPFFNKLSTEVDLCADENYSKPLLSVQVTGFEGGGLCIGIIYNHVIMDGNSFFHFMKSWAECSRALPIANLPQHNRTVCKRENKKSESLCYTAHDIVSVGIEGAKIYKFVTDDSQSRPSSGNDEKCQEPLLKMTDLVHSTFCFTEEMIQELKHQSRTATSFVAVAAHFWRCIMRARGVPREKAVYFVVMADCRKRVKPPLLPTYFGNCLCLGLAEARADILINSDISFAADIIQQLISSCTEEARSNI